MKKLFLTLVLVGGLTSVNAQTETEKSTETGYNKWSIEVNGGVNKATGLFSSGYFSATGAPFTIDLGTRYMYNNKFGLKADAGYSTFASFGDSKPFTTKYLRGNVQGVINLARVMDFDEFTKKFNILFHTGFGMGVVRASGKSIIDSKRIYDIVGNFIVGIGTQYKLSNKLAVNLDLTSVTNFSQDRTFDGITVIPRRDSFAGGIFSLTTGLTYYLGKNTEHADWSFDADKNKEIAKLKKKIADVETLMNDSDKDGVPDYLDNEPKTMAGVAVNSKGIAIDKNKNGVPDEIESYMNKTYGDGKTNPDNNGKPNGKDESYTPNNNLIKNFINEGYITVYFEYNKSVPTDVSTSGIDYILTYLRKNPEASVDIIGHADELGRSAYNGKLSADRANSVKNVLVKAKIAESRLNIVPAGEDNSVDKNSDLARNLVRRVTFRVK